ncbi:hypothetical protein TRFO_34894 [Tritrichomonas foetus]|uniref:Dymeclin n=1 Tax=Tritrichomonas foetus TaxID=1144522 RepID=A0A1J4JHT2_9EUKA|nr:hypothetical protein TRFO_34894 [Tritrichomonas foetus]|eukprot:OHS98670.1 hypothetical protein TRFO_34894 [Tritrichomonas foetus]
MGGGSSINPVESTLSQLAQADYSQNTSFWNDLLNSYSNFPDSIQWYPSTLHQIAQKYPSNMVKLITFCNTFIENLRMTDPSKITKSTFDQLCLTCQIFTSSCSVILTSQGYSSLITTIRPQISIFQNGLPKCLCIAHLTGLSEEGQNIMQEGFIKARYDIIHALLCTINLNYFTRFIENPPFLEISLPEFPANIFFKMSCELKDINPDHYSLFKNCIALSAKLQPNITEAISAIDSNILQKFFIESHIDQYFLTFLFQCLLNNKKSVKKLIKENKTNILIFKILNFAQLKLEAVGISFMHTLSACSIQLILEEPEAVTLLNQNFALEFTSKFQPQQGTFADVLIEVLFGICNSNSLIPTFSEIFKLIAPRVTQLSVFCSMKIIDVFQLIQTMNFDQKIYATEQLMEAFAIILQRREGNEYFRMIMAQRTATFQFMNKLKSVKSSAIEIIQKYLAVVRGIILKMNSKKVDLSEINSSILSVDVESIFPKVVHFDVNPFSLSGRIEGSWTEWCEVLFLQCFKAEFDVIKQYDASSSK